MRRSSPYWRHFDCNCDHPGLSEIPVRQALNYAIDRKTIIAKALHGVGEINWTVLSPDMWAHNNNVHTYPYDLRIANQLLDGAGWRLGPDGVREKAGVKLHLKLAYAAGDPAWSEIVELVRTTWKQIGVHVRFQDLPAEHLFRAVPKRWDRTDRQVRRVCVFVGQPPRRPI